jgi:hypothetical protein
MTMVRRFLVIQLLMLWQGGFLFYAAFVVPVGTDVLGGSFEQGRITRLVAPTLNLLGAAALAVFAWELLHAPASRRSQKYWLRSSWAVLAAGLVGLFLLHPRMLELVDFESSRKLDRDRFRFLHRTYLWISAIQWLAGLVFAFVLLRSWQTTDRNPVTSGSP